MATFLEQINVLELSPTPRPANRRAKILQKTAAPTTLSAEDKKKAEAEARRLPDKEQQMTKEEQAAADKLAADELAALKDGKAKAEKSLADLGATIKKSIEALAGDKPDLAAALEPLAKAAEVEMPELPALVEKAAPEPAVPEAFKAEWAAMQKSAQAAQERVEALEKSAARKEYVTKAEKDFGAVPGASIDELGDLLQKAHDAGHGEDLEKVLKATQGLVAKSEAFVEKGSSLGGGGDGDDAYDKLEKMAAEKVQKSAEPMTKAQALRQVRRENPQLAREASAQ